MNVSVYWNSRKRMYSIKGKDPKTGKTRVLMIKPFFALLNAEFKTNKSGIDRIRRTRQKTVVAEIHGTLAIPTNPEYVQGTQVRFNPYHMDTFQTTSGEPVHHADLVHCTPKGVFAL
jgi:hypothetical protein